MRTIRVDDDVYEALKELAAPFEDTPNTVIRKLLKQVTKLPVREPSEIKIIKTRKKLTPQSVYEHWLTYTLWKDFSGRACKGDVTEATINTMRKHGLLTDADFEKVSTGETKAENTIAFGRNRLKEEGIIKNNSPRGIWELTIEGVQKARELDNVIQKLS